jgi:hypothetical protein
MEWKINNCTTIFLSIIELAQTLYKQKKPAIIADFSFLSDLGSV